MLEEQSITSEMKALTARLDETEASLSDAISDKKALSEELDALHAANANLKEEVFHAQAEVSQSKNNQTEMLARVNQLMDRLDDRDTALVDLRGEKAELVVTAKKTQELNDRLQSEIKDLVDDRRKMKSRMVESDRALVKVAKQKETVSQERDALAKEKADLEESIKREADAANESLAHQNEETENLNIRLRESEKALAIATGELEQIKAARDALAKDKADLEEERGALETKLELATSSKYNTLRPTTLLQASLSDHLDPTPSCAVWDDEKKQLEARILEGDQALLLATQEKESLEHAKEETERELVGELERLKDAYAVQVEETEDMHMRLSRTESTLSSVTKEKDSLEAQRHALVSTLCEDPAASVPPADPVLPIPSLQIPTSASGESQVERMQAFYAREKRQMMDRQSGLERMLKDALHSEDKENPRRSPANTPRKTLQQLAHEWKRSSPHETKRSSPSIKPPMPQPLSAKALAPFSPKGTGSGAPFSPKGTGSNAPAPIPRARNRSPSPFKKRRSPSLCDNIHPMDDKSATRTRIALDSPLRRREAPVDPE